MNQDFFRCASNNLLYIHHKKTSVNGPSDFILHQHSHPEIYFFISGKASFIYEGSRYLLNPYDVMIVPPYTLHQPVPEYYSSYSRYVFYPYPDFYKKMDCYNISSLFSKVDASTAKISGNIIKDTDAKNILYKLALYSNNFQDINQTIINCLFYELLYTLYSITNFETFNSKNTVIQAIIGYINENFKYITNITEIAAALGYSPSYISTLFKKHIGITIHDYITSKRLANVDILYKKGENLTSACMNSGFSSYNNFAYVYKKKYNKPPKLGFIEDNLL